jgi:hypothetical protein
MKFKLDRIISIATLVALVVAIFLLVKRPATVVVAPSAPAATNAQSSDAPSSSTASTNAQSSGQKVDQAEPAARQGQQTQTSQAGGGYLSLPTAASPAGAAQPSKNSATSPGAKAGAGINSEAVSAAINKMLGASGAGLTPDTNVGDGPPNIKDQKVTYDGDTVHGQFLTEIAGKDVWITISGHMGQKDGYATFDPTEFKVGDVEVPVALVNPALQQKLAEERDRLKLSEPAK